MALLIVFAALLGLALGSFANVAIYRLPRASLSVSDPPFSFCPACNRTLPWYENIPVISWLVLRGRCSGCKAAISVRYPIVELAVGLISVCLTLTYAPIATPAGDWGLLGVMLLFCLGLVVSALVDLEHKIIPDQVTVLGMALAPVLCALVPEIHRTGVSVLPDVEGWMGWWIAPAARLGVSLPGPVGLRMFLGLPVAGLIAVVSAWVGNRAGEYLRRQYPEENLSGWPWGLALAAALGVPAATLLAPGFVDHPRFLAVCASLAGMGLAGGALWVTGVLGTWIFRQDAMGFGDVKLLGLIGAILGWQGAILSLLLGSLIGSCVGLPMKLLRGESTIPFGPYLALGALATLFWGPAVLHFWTVAYPTWLQQQMGGP